MLLSEGPKRSVTLFVVRVWYWLLLKLCVENLHVFIFHIICLGCFRFEENLGSGIHILMLSGEARAAEESSFKPLSRVHLPHHMFGMLDACDTDKEVLVEERVLLYYKYNSRPADCVKIFTSVYQVKNFGFR